MPQQVIEGTWEEIKSREAELIGRHLRVIVKPEKAAGRKASPKKAEPAAAQTKEFRAYGLLKGIINTEDYLREKREDTAREDRSLFG